MRVLLGGEGPTDIGDWAIEAPYRPTPIRGGVIGTLLKVFKPAAVVTDGVVWKHIKKYRSGDHATPEARNVLGLALRAREAGLDAIVFARDRDGYSDRELDLEDGIARAAVAFPSIRVAGGAAVETIESWLLTIKGHPKAERLTDPKSQLSEAHGADSAEEKSDIAATLNLNAKRAHNASFDQWLDRVVALK